MQLQTMQHKAMPLKLQGMKKVKALMALRPTLVWAVALLVAALALPAMAQDVPPAPPAPPSPSSPSSPDGAQQNPYQRTVRLSYVDGQVEIYEGDQLAFASAMTNMPLVQGMRIVTGPDGRAEIQFEDGSVVRAAPNSSVELTQLTRNDDGSTVNVIDALSGLSYYELNAQQNEYTVGLGPDTIVPEQGSTVFRLDLDHPGPILADMSGNLQIFNGQTLVVATSANQSAAFNANDPTLYNLSEGVVANSWDQWNSDRDQQLAQLAQQASPNVGDQGVAATDNSAWNELDSYGNWYDVPGYGQGWAPSGVDANWDPYGDGAWGYYPSMGYTWISAYPWGWWPYHCGAWSWFSGNGWLWFPGNCGWGAYGGGWAPIGTVWGRPPGYHLPPPPPRPLPRFQNVRPIHGPGHPIYGNPLDRVRRGPDHIFYPIGSGWHKPPAGVLHWQGQTLRPIAGYRSPLGGSPAQQGSGNNWNNNGGANQTSQPVFGRVGTASGARIGFEPTYAPVRSRDAGSRPVYQQTPDGKDNRFTQPGKVTQMGPAWRLAPREANPREGNSRVGNQGQQNSWQYQPRFAQPREPSPRFNTPHFDPPHIDFRPPPAPHVDAHPRR